MINILPDNGKWHPSMELQELRMKLHWPPVNTELVSRLKLFVEASVKEVDFRESREFIKGEVKKDLSLFIFTLKRLSALSLARSRNAPKESMLLPNELLNEASLADFQEVFNTPSDAISDLNFSTTSKEAAVLTLQTLVGATVAEVISDFKELDPDLAFTYGLLRQFGLTLIAWTYPSLYSRLVSTNSEETLDDRLTEALGFSPSLLGLRLAREWGLSTSALAKGIGDKALVHPEFNREVVVLETLEQICILGEAFASSCIGDENQSLWAKALTKIETLIGSEGVQSLKDVLSERTSEYCRLAPELFQWKIAPTATLRKPIIKADERFINNVYIRHCPKVVQEHLKALYDDLKESTRISLEGVKTLTKVILPQCGFTGGVIYLVDPSNLGLFPRFLYGEVPAALKTRFSYTSHLHKETPVVQAFGANAPIPIGFEEGIKADFKGIAGVLGEFQRTGVLAAVIDDKPSISATKAETKPLGTFLSYFKAMRQALCDCLNIR
jgi:hypothetical protein